MNEIQFYGQMAIPVAEARSNRRERIQLATPGIFLRSVASEARSIFSMIEQTFSAATKPVTYCNYNPAEC